MISIMVIIKKLIVKILIQKKQRNWEIKKKKVQQINL